MTTLGPEQPRHSSLVSTCFPYMSTCPKELPSFISRFSAFTQVSIRLHAIPQLHHPLPSLIAIGKVLARFLTNPRISPRCIHASAFFRDSMSFYAYPHASTQVHAFPVATTKLHALPCFSLPCQWFPRTSTRVRALSLFLKKRPHAFQRFATSFNEPQGAPKRFITPQRLSVCA